MWFWRVLLVLNFLAQYPQMCSIPSTWVSAWTLICCLVFAVLPHFKHNHLSPEWVTRDVKIASSSSGSKWISYYKNWKTNEEVQNLQSIKMLSVPPSSFFGLGKDSFEKKKLWIFTTSVLTPPPPPKSCENPNFFF